MLLLRRVTYNTTIVSPWPSCMTFFSMYMLPTCSNSYHNTQTPFPPFLSSRLLSSLSFLLSLFCFFLQNQDYILHISYSLLFHLTIHYGQIPMLKYIPTPSFKIVYCYMSVCLSLVSPLVVNLLLCSVLLLF